MEIGQILVSIADTMVSNAATEAAKLVPSPAIPTTFSLTERVLVRMMREDTGCSVLDSGGAYGRAWQRALREDFSNRVATTYGARTYECSYGKDKGKTTLDLDVTIDLFTYLASRLEYDRALTRQLVKFLADEANEEADFPKYIAEQRGADVDHVWSNNSYNTDNYLSGTVQYTQFDLDGEEYVILRVHGGCDVRGGYTAAKVFKCDDNGCGSFGDWFEADLFPDYQELTALKDALKANQERQAGLFPQVEAQERAEVSMLGDDVHWHVGGWTDHGEGCKSLDDYPVTDIENRSQWVKGTICILPDHTALCPETGVTLRAGFCH